jgi:hypothetical protein
VAISASVHPTIASRVTAVPRKSWNVIPTMPAFLAAVLHDAWKPCDVHGRPALFVRMSGPCFFAAASAALSGMPTGSV